MFNYWKLWYRMEKSTKNQYDIYVFISWIFIRVQTPKKIHSFLFPRIYASMKRVLAVADQAKILSVSASCFHWWTYLFLFSEVFYELMAVHMVAAHFSLIFFLWWKFFDKHIIIYFRCGYLRDASTDSRPFPHSDS